MNSYIHEDSSFKECPIISSLHLHELFMNNWLILFRNVHDWIKLMNYSWIFLLICTQKMQNESVIYISLHENSWMFIHLNYAFMFFKTPIFIYIHHLFMNYILWLYSWIKFMKHLDEPVMNISWIFMNVSLKFLLLLLEEAKSLVHMVLTLGLSIVSCLCWTPVPVKR